MYGLLSRVNWVDIFALILLIKISYASSRIGVGKQILPLILLVLTLTIPLYNYRIIAGFFIKMYSFNPALCYFLIYIVITFICFAIYVFISRIMGFSLSLGETAMAGIEKIGGTFLGLLRSVLIIGIIMIGLLLAPIKPIETSVKRSYSGFFFIRTNLKIYSSLVNLVLKNDKISYRDILKQLLSGKEESVADSVSLKGKSKF